MTRIARLKRAELVRDSIRTLRSKLDKTASSQKRAELVEDIDLAMDDYVGLMDDDMWSEGPVMDSDPMGDMGLEDPMMGDPMMDDMDLDDMGLLGDDGMSDDFSLDDGMGGLGDDLDGLGGLDDDMSLMAGDPMTDDDTMMMSAEEDAEAPSEEGSEDESEGSDEPDEDPDLAQLTSGERKLTAAILNKIADAVSHIEAFEVRAKSASKRADTSRARKAASDLMVYVANVVDSRRKTASTDRMAALKAIAKQTVSFHKDITAIK